MTVFIVLKKEFLFVKLTGKTCTYKILSRTEFQQTNIKMCWTTNNMKLFVWPYPFFLKQSKILEHNISTKKILSVFNKKYALYKVYQNSSFVLFFNIVDTATDLEKLWTKKRKSRTLFKILCPWYAELYTI